MRVGNAKIFKDWLLNAWKCTQITLYLYYLIIGARGEGWVMPEFLEIGFNMLENVLIDIVSLLFDHRSPRWRMDSARFFKKWLLNAWKCTQMTLFLYYLII